MTAYRDHLINVAPSSLPIYSGECCSGRAGRSALGATYAGAGSVARRAHRLGSLSRAQQAPRHYPTERAAVGRSAGGTMWATELLTGDAALGRSSNSAVW